MPTFRLGSLATTMTTLLLLLCPKAQARMREVMPETQSSIIKDDKEEPYCPCQLLPKPDLWDKTLTARWMVHSLEWGVLTTISSRLSTESEQAMPFGNVYSFVDGSCDNSTGIPYFYGTYMDQSFQDIRRNPFVSLTLSEASLATVCGGQDHLLPACDASRRHQGYYGDAESPVCARMTLSGRMDIIDADSDEYRLAQNALFQRHPDMEGWVRIACTQHCLALVLS